MGGGCGSRGGGESGAFVGAGCWFGSLAEFRERVRAVHGATAHGREYEAAAAMLEAHAELWRQ